MDKIVAIIILIFGIAIFSYAPLKYDYGYSVFCGVAYVVIILLYNLVRKKANYFDFDSLFFFTFFFVTLYYPIFMFETDATRYVFFLFQFDTDVIPRSSALAVLGMAAYVFGSLLVFPKSNKQEDSNEKKSGRLVKTKKFYYIALILFILYIATGGYFELRAVYFGGVYEANPVSKYINLFYPAFLFAGIICDFYNAKIISPNKFRFRKISIIAYITILVIVLGLLFAGSRTIPLQVILMILGLYSLLYKKVNLIRFLGFILIGLITMFSVVILRGYQQDSKTSGADIVMDLIINNRNNFLAIEQVRDNGYTYGESMLSQFVAPIPFFQNLLLSSGYKEQELSSQKLFTFITLGELDKFYGIGTTIIADVYIAFGVIGAIFFMSFLGYTINKNRIKANNSIFALTAYAIFISYSIYLARAEYFFFMRYLIWTLMIVLLATKKFRFN
ncbi:oligosaccharide repeat unit polymerase [Chryseobacterium suipulveris]|uniref:Oligosaccharide repeat unit polymerase n=1 Tax=Chryseobacterium suipulveris TaxID=2929800 RepID=A0ABY4BV19_9FLAO|nr:O-antigen polymerase [Chryseobacterium suipulveris]UOE41548.1 oligosaccharide repeat unit polymerase [Chryseobacterium suipulveris]